MIAMNHSQIGLEYYEKQNNNDPKQGNDNNVVSNNKHPSIEILWM